MQMEMSDGILPCYLVFVFNLFERVHLAQERIIILKVLAYSTDKITISRCVACLYNRPLSSCSERIISFPFRKLRLIDRLTNQPTNEHEGSIIVDQSKLCDKKDSRFSFVRQSVCHRFLKRKLNLQLIMEYFYIYLW